MTYYNKKVITILKLTVAAAIYAAGINFFLDPKALAPGGVTGISILLSYMTGIGTGIWILLLNIPLFLLGIYKFGFRFMVSSIYCIVLITVFSNGMEKMPIPTLDLPVAAIAGGCLVAVGMGYILREGATTGGMDIIIKVIQYRHPMLRTGTLLLLSDALVILLSAIILKDLNLTLYAAMAAVTTAFVLDLILYGRDEAKVFFIISDKSLYIAERLLQELGIGATYLEGTGAFRGRKKQVIMCVMRKQISRAAVNIVRSEDKHAFMIISRTTEIFGEGYTSLDFHD